MAILKGIKFKDSDEIHQLDYEESIANKPTLVKSFNDLEDKPFYTEDGGTVEILPQSDYELVYDSEIALCMMSPTLSEHLEIGNKYNVKFDGQTYTCTAFGKTNEDEGINVVAIGNMKFEGGADTEEPFLIADMYTVDGTSLQSMMCVDGTEDSTHNIAIYKSNEIVHKLDSKYVDAYTTSQIDEMFGAYVTEVDTLLGGDE